MLLMVPMHGVGGAQDLPIPVNYAIAGSGAALTVSFVVLIIAWRQPRFDSGAAGSPVNRHVASIIEAGLTRVVARSVGMLIFGYIAWITIWGPDLVTNPIFGIVYVLLWVGLVPASLILGPVWKFISPTRTIYAGIVRLAGPGARGGLSTLPNWVGYWPAAVGLFAFVWLELVYDRATYLDAIQLWFAGYLAIVILGAILFGTKWFERADPFEAYSSLIAHLAPVGRRANGQLVWQTPLNHLDGLNPSPSRVGVVAVLLGSTAYDGFTRSTQWVKFSQAASMDVTLLGTLTLMAFCAFVWLTFSVGTMATASPPRTTRRALPALFAHSLVPIIVGYVVAHYLSLLLEYGQQVIIQLSDPMVDGSDLFGTANWNVNYFLSTNPSTLAMIKVVAVLSGHVVGVIAAHDRAVKVLPRRHQITGQLALLAVMVTYTVGGIYLLFSG